MTAIPPKEDPSYLIYPSNPSVGAIGAFCLQSRAQEIREYETHKTLRTWEVRGVISDHVPLAGDAPSALSHPTNHLFKVNGSPLWIYLHSGGQNAVYFELVADAAQNLSYIAVRVETRLPSNAMLLARQPLNSLLDVIVRDFGMPLMLQRLELISPEDGGLLLWEMPIPERSGVHVGPLGGILQAVPFAPYDALYREAIVSSSPFYRLLCAWKIYEGTARIRRWIREESQRRNVQERQPGDIQIAEGDLSRFGLKADFSADIKNAGQLFERAAEMRHAIAHFLIERDDQQEHVYLANGAQLQLYSMVSAALLHYAHQTLEDLRLFCVRHIPMVPRGAMILPTPENHQQFRVRAIDYGML